MARSTLLYSTGGSNTAASGAGPTTAKTGTAAAHTFGAATTLITLTDFPTLSGVAVNDVLWLGTSLGTRHLSRVISADNAAKTVTVEDSFTIALGSPVDYAIGGKRLSMVGDSSRTDVEDAKAGWRFELEAGTHAWVSTLGVVPAVGDVTYGPVELVGASGSTPVLTWTTDDPLLSLNANAHLRIHNLDVQNTTSTADTARVLRITANAGYYELSESLFKCAGSVLYTTNNNIGRIIGCDIESTYNDGIVLANRSVCTILKCVIHGCGVSKATSGTGQGISLTQESAGSMAAIVSCIIRDNYSSGISVHSNETLVGNLILNNVFHDNGDYGIWFRDTMTERARHVVANNLFTSNGAYGLAANSSVGSDIAIWNDHNGYWDNLSGETDNITKGSSSVTVSDDPYRDAANDDYNLGTDAAGGECRDVGYGYEG